MSFEPTQALSDIVDNCARIAEYVGQVDRSAFERDTLKRDAVERCLERICEAAVRLGDRANSLLPNQPWSDIRGMGNWLRHAYDQLNIDIIWDVVERELPVLAAEARRCIEQLHGNL